MNWHCPRGRSSHSRRLGFLFWWFTFELGLWKWAWLAELFLYSPLSSFHMLSSMVSMVCFLWSEMRGFLSVIFVPHMVTIIWILPLNLFGFRPPSMESTSALVGNGLHNSFLASNVWLDFATNSLWARAWTSLVSLTRGIVAKKRWCRRISFLPHCPPSEKTHAMGIPSIKVSPSHFH